MHTFAIALLALSLIGSEAPIYVRLADELTRHPENYTSRIIVVEGKVVSSEEMTLLFVQSGATDDPILVVFAPEKQNRQDRRLHSQLKKKGEAQARLQGTFEASSSRSYGHLNCCRYRLTVNKVLEVN